MAADALAQVIATALQASRDLDEERVRAIVREEIAKALQTAPQTTGWQTPPAAARSRGISLKRLRSMMDAGTVEKRAKNPQAEQPKWEVSLQSLDAALAAEAHPTNAASWAAARSQKRTA